MLLINKIAVIIVLKDALVDAYVSGHRLAS